MERDSTHQNINSIYHDDDDANNLYDSYMGFVTSSNSALRMVLDILYNQQVAFNQIISTSRQHNTASVSHPSRGFATPIFAQNRQSFPQGSVNPMPTATTIFPNGPNIAQYFHTTENMRANIHNIPSADERDAAIEYVTFGDIDEPLNTICSISHRDFSANDTVIQLSECRHIFDASSILQWFTRNSQCPLCRNDIRLHTETELNTPTSTPLPFAQQLASMITEQLSTDRDFSGNINIELAIPGRSSQ